jgi:hypothetical protein
MPALLRGALALVLATCAFVSLEGCEPTEIVVVTDTDAIPGQDFVGVQFQLAQGNFAWADTSHFPVTWGLTPQGSVTDFDVTVTLSHTLGQFGPDRTDNPFASRKASHVRFVDGAMKVLFIPVFKSCGCVGTNCPNPVPTECREMMSPVLADFDEGNIPRLPKSPSQ